MFFAIERTYLAWVNVAVLILFIALSLLAGGAGGGGPPAGQSGHGGGCGDNRGCEAARVRLCMLPCVVDMLLHDLEGVSLLAGCWCPCSPPAGHFGHAGGDDCQGAALHIVTASLQEMSKHCLEAEEGNRADVHVFGLVVPQPQACDFHTRPFACMAATVYCVKMCVALAHCMAAPA